MGFYNITARVKDAELRLVELHSLTLVCCCRLAFWKNQVSFHSSLLIGSWNDLVCNLTTCLFRCRSNQSQRKWINAAWFEFCIMSRGGRQTSPKEPAGWSTPQCFSRFLSGQKALWNLRNWRVSVDKVHKSTDSRAETKTSRLALMRVAPALSSNKAGPAKDDILHAKWAGRGGETSGQVAACRKCSCCK